MVEFFRKAGAWERQPLLSVAAVVCLGPRQWWRPPPRWYSWHAATLRGLLEAVVALAGDATRVCVRQALISGAGFSCVVATETSPFSAHLKHGSANFSIFVFDLFSFLSTRSGFISTFVCRDIFHKHAATGRASATRMDISRYLR